MYEEVETRTIVRPLDGEQVTIPPEFRRALGIDDQSLLQLTLMQGELRIRPFHAATEVPSSSWLQEAYEAFAPIREELAEKYSEDQIDAVIDRAVRTVRQPVATMKVTTLGIDLGV